jgi:hypothetical protein
LQKRSKVLIVEIAEIDCVPNFGANPCATEIVAIALVKLAARFPSSEVAKGKAAGRGK